MNKHLRIFVVSRAPELCTAYELVSANYLRRSTLPVEDLVWGTLAEMPTPTLLELLYDRGWKLPVILDELEYARSENENQGHGELPRIFRTG